MYSFSRIAVQLMYIVLPLAGSGQREATCSGESWWSGRLPANRDGPANRNRSGPRPVRLEAGSRRIDPWSCCQPRTMEPECSQRRLHRLPERLDRGWLADSVEKEQLARNPHLALHLTRFGYALTRIRGRGTNHEALLECPMGSKVLCGDNLRDRFTALLSNAYSVDIATAWATRGEHLRALDAAANRGVKIRVIVGISGNATHPDALKELSEITAGDLRIVPEGDRLFHPKLYLFERHGDGIVKRQAWIGSANFTRAGFGGHSSANEEIVLEVGPGNRADALADWFQERWDRCPVDPSVSEEIRRYTEDWKRSPPHRLVRQITSGSVSDPRDLLDDDAHRPLSLEGYRQALIEREEQLRDEGLGWGILDPRGRSYMKAISDRRKLLLGEARWSELNADSRRQLKGSYRRKDLEWWGLTGRIVRKSWPAVRQNERKVRASLEAVRQAHDREFPDIAVEAMRALMDIDDVGYGTATLLLTLARPDRLLSLNTRSEKGYGALSGLSPSTLGKPENYRELLRWLYRQRWYHDGPPTDERLVPIWRFRAALVDPFVYEPT